MRTPKDHEVAELVNKLTRTALDFSTHQSLRMRLRAVVLQFLEDMKEGLPG